MKNTNLKDVFRKRDDKSHKGNYGKVLIYAGSESYPGAAFLACKSALKSGVGQVILANDDLNKTMYTALPEVTYIKRDLKKSNLIDLNIKSILFGNGLDYPNKTIAKDFSLMMKEFNHKLIIDATGLKYLKDYIKSGEKISPEIIITPHIKEFCELIDINIKSSDVFDYAKEVERFLENYQRMVVVLKSYETLIKTRKQERIFSNPNSGFAHAGSGDALAGFISGLMAYSSSYSVDICYASSFILNAALEKEEQIHSSMTTNASSILDYLPIVLKKYVD